VAVVLAAVTDPNVWKFRSHPEVWLLVAFLIGAYVYAIRVIGPRLVRPGQPVVRWRQIACFVAGIALLWAASDWPIHDVGENNLYSVHMLQHMILAYFAPPLLLMATPEWFLRLLLGTGRFYAVFRWFTKPVVAAVIFNVGVMVIHIPALVNAAVTNGPLHYSLHVMTVLTALLMWMPVCGPLPEVRLQPAGKMIYLFAQSIIPTVPAAWLTFADGVVYTSYDHLPRVFGLTVTDDQQIAGVLMKVGGSIFLWSIVTVLFFNRFMKNWSQENGYARMRMPDAEIVGNDDEQLTYEQVASEFERSAPAIADPEVRAPRE
jgi:putative membrane protein